MRKTIFLSICSLLLISCASVANGSNSGGGGIIIGPGGTTSTPTNSGGNPFNPGGNSGNPFHPGGNSSAGGNSSTGGNPFNPGGNSSTGGNPFNPGGNSSGGGNPFHPGGNSSSSSSTGGEESGYLTSYPVNEVREFLGFNGAGNVNVPSFSAEKFTINIGVTEYGYPVAAVSGYYGNDKTAIDAANGYLGTLNGAQWRLDDSYLQSHNVYLAYDPTNKVGMEIGVNFNSATSLYSVDTAIVVFPDETSSSSAAATSVDFVSNYPYTEVSTFLNENGATGISLPTFGAEKYFYTYATSDYGNPLMYLYGFYANEADGVTATNTYLDAFNNSADWALYNYWESDQYFLAVHNTEKVYVYIGYYYYDDVGLYGLNAVVLVDTSAGASSDTPTTSVDFIFAYPYNAISTFLSGNNVSGVNIPTLGAEKYDYSTYTRDDNIPVFDLFGFYATDDAGVSAVNTYLDAFYNSADWALYDYWESDQYFLAVDDTNQVAVIISYYYFSDLALYGAEACIMVNPDATSGSAEASTNIDFAASFPTKELNTFLAKNDASGVNVPSFAATKYATYEDVNGDGWPYLNIMGFYNGESETIEALNDYLDVYYYDESWTLYDYWESDQYFLAVHSTEKVFVVLSYYYYTDVELYGISACVYVSPNGGSQSAATSNGSMEINWTTVSYFPSSAIQNELGSLGVSLSFPAVSGTRYGYSHIYNPEMGQTYLYVYAIMSESEVSDFFTNMRTALINSGFTCNYINNNGQIQLYGGDPNGLCIYSIAQVPTGYDLGFTLQSGEVAILIAIGAPAQGA